MKMNYLSLMLSLMVSVFLWSCHRSITKEELTSYINDPDNGLRQEVLEGPVKVSLTYRPTDLIVDQIAGKEWSEQDMAKERETYARYYYFILSMSANDKDIIYRNSNSQSQFGETLKRLNFSISEYVYGIGEERDTIHLADYYVPNFYGMGGATQIMLAFPKEKEYEYFEIRLKELGLGIGEQRFRFRNKDIMNTPELMTAN